MKTTISIPIFRMFLKKVIDELELTIHQVEIINRIKKEILELNGS